MKKRFLSSVNYTIALLLSLFGLCDCSMQKNEYGCPYTDYREIETVPAEGNDSTSNDAPSDEEGDMAKKEEE